MFRIQHMPLSILLSTAFLLGCPKQGGAPGGVTISIPTLNFNKVSKHWKRWTERPVRLIMNGSWLLSFRSEPEARLCKCSLQRRLDSRKTW